MKCWVCRYGGEGKPYSESDFWLKKDLTQVREQTRQLWDWVIFQVGENKTTKPLRQESAWYDTGTARRPGWLKSTVRGGVGIGGEIREILEGQTLKGLLDHIKWISVKGLVFLYHREREALGTLNQSCKNNSAPKSSILLPCLLVPALLPGTRKISTGAGHQHWHQFENRVGKIWTLRSRYLYSMRKYYTLELEGSYIELVWSFNLIVMKQGLWEKNRDQGHRIS